MLHNTSKRQDCGFSLIELMVVILLLTIIMGAIFQQIASVQQRSASEQNKLDLLQESREFLDQMTRDLHQAGYPNSRLYAPGLPAATVTSPANAVGLVKVGVGDLWFEGDINNDGTVESVKYHYDSGTNCSCNCPCVRRSETAKVAGDPLTGQGTAPYQTEVQYALNGAGTADPIFFAFEADGTAVNLSSPMDFNVNPDVIARIKTIQVRMRVQGNPDLRTGQRPVSTLETTVMLNNCSQAGCYTNSSGATVCGGGMPMSCQ
jgi:prepilin-type N-terminal cleavage/methylation domain-containing protein